MALWRRSFLVKELRAAAGMAGMRGMAGTGTKGPGTMAMAEGHLHRPARCGPARYLGLPLPHFLSRRIRYHAESGMVTTLLYEGADTSFWQPEKTVAAMQTLSFRR